MKTQILCAIAVLGLLNGCAWSGKHTGASDYNDQNVLMGGPAFCANRVSSLLRAQLDQGFY